MRISGDATSLVRVAELLVLERDRLDGDLANVAMTPLPAMPPWLRVMVERELQEAAADARAVALEAEARALELKRRAVFMFAAAGGVEWIRLGKKLGSAWGSASMVRRELGFIRAFDDLEALSTGAVGRFEPTSLEATNAWFKWQTRLPESLIRTDAFRHIADKDWAAAREAAAGPGRVTSTVAGLFGPETGARILTASKWAGRLSGPLLIGSSALTLAGHERYGGARGAIDHWGVGVGGMSAGVLLTYALLAPVAPELVVAAGLVALGIAGWQIGNLLWDHKRAIQHAVAGASSWVWHHSPEGILLDHRDDIKQGLVSASEWGHQQTKEVVQWTGDKLSTAKHVGSSIEHGITHLIPAWP